MKTTWSRSRLQSVSIRQTKPQRPSAVPRREASEQPPCAAQWISPWQAEMIDAAALLQSCYSDSADSSPRVAVQTPVPWSCVNFWAVKKSRRASDCINICGSIRSVQVRLHMMCANHPNIVQILEVYANSVQFPHESSPRWRSLTIFSLVLGFLFVGFCFFTHAGILLKQSQTPDRHGDDGGRWALPQNQSAQALYREDGQPGHQTGSWAGACVVRSRCRFIKTFNSLILTSPFRSAKPWNIATPSILHIETWSQRTCFSKITLW